MGSSASYGDGRTLAWVQALVIAARVFCVTFL